MIYEPRNRIEVVTPKGNGITQKVKNILKKSAFLIQKNAPI